MNNEYGTDQDELYYTAKNFHKLKFSNTAYIDNIEKDKKENENEINQLKKEYEKLKIDVASLKRKTLYSSGRLKSAGLSDNVNSEIIMLRLKLDTARNEKDRAKKEWKKFDEQLKQKKDELKVISNDNNPYMKRIKLLENKLDKAMIKYNEAMSIKRTYEQILAKLKEERTGYDQQITDIQKSLKTKQNDLKEFKQLVLDAKQAKTVSQLLVENTKLSQKAFERHFDQLVSAHEHATRPDMKTDKKEKKFLKPDTSLRTLSEDSNNADNNYSIYELERLLKIYEEAEKSIINGFNTNDINEICQKYSNSKETKEKLEEEIKNLENLFETLRYKKNYLTDDLNKLKYFREDGISSKHIIEYERKTEIAIKECEDSRHSLKRIENVHANLNAGFFSILTVLRNKIFEEIINDDKYAYEDQNLKNFYSDITNQDEYDVKVLIEKIKLICLYLSQRYNHEKEIINYDEDKYNIIDENEIEPLYVNQNEDSNQLSLYDENYIEVENEFVNKESNLRQNIRPHTTNNTSKKTNRLEVLAKDKRK